MNTLITSGTVFGGQVTNKERFITLLEQFASSNIWLRISIYHLLNDEKFDRIMQKFNLADYFHQKLAHYTEDGSFPTYEVDPTICSITNETDEFENLVELKKLFEKYKYSIIFYKKYRCGLVHEARINEEFRFDYGNIEKPYYSNYIDTDDNNSQKRQLIIPIVFILEEINKINLNIKEWLLKQSINPYERYGL